MVYSKCLYNASPHSDTKNELSIHMKDNGEILWKDIFHKLFSGGDFVEVVVGSLYFAVFF